jgi:hypothetical protein
MLRYAPLLALLACQPAPPPTAAEYCETTAEMFCDFYLRCERMAAADMDECRAVFLESCNSTYEPHYTALEARGMLTLSEPGIEACEVHLAEVACEDHIFDLDGGCSEMWIGQVEEGGACSIGIESFVCEPGLECTLGLDLCGTCTPDDGEPPPTPSWTLVGVGEACDMERRCPYRAACLEGQCVQTPLQGEACSETLPCATGFCDAGTCAPLRADGTPCTASSECVSGACGEEGTCGELPGVCFD